MSRNKVNFWLEDFRSLFDDILIIPQNRYSVEERFNILTRLVIIISLLLMCFVNFKYGLMFLLLSLVVIISIYYSKDKNNNIIIQENFQFRNNLSNDKNMQFDPKLYLDNVFNKVETPTKFPPKSALFCTPNQYLTNNQTQWSLNQHLANGTTFISDLNCSPSTLLTPQTTTPKLVNKNTLKPPIIAPPIWDLNSWRDNDFVNYSRINDQRMMDKYRSGYYVQQCPCEDWNKSDHSQCKNKKSNRDELIIENYNGSSNSKSHYYQKDNISPIQYPQARPYPYVESVDIIEDQPYLQPGDILTVAGYNPNNLKHNLPSNAAFGTCEKQPVFNEYNKDLYTQTIQPGFYSRSQIIEPISSNIGISFDQQFLPTTLEQEGNDFTFIEHDPRQFKPGKRSLYTQGVSQDNVYDPRSNGYGTNYRSYVDRLTGQPRFYYDDINAIRKPNYIVRSKIDTFDFGETYGPMRDDYTINQNDCNIREKAQQKFLDDSIGFRTDLQQSLMRKRNNEMWQLRKFPLSRAGQRTMRGGGSGGSGGANGGTNV